MRRRALSFGAAACGVAASAQPSRLRPAVIDSPEGLGLLARLRMGGLVLFFRHAATHGEACDSSFRVGERAGQRNLSPEGRMQARRIGLALRASGVPIALPVLAGPVFRARDTAEEAFGALNVRVTDGLLADDYAGDRLGWVLRQHGVLFNTPATDPAANAVLVGHRTPAIMVLGEAVGGRAFPEGGALVLRPGATGAEILGILDLVPLPWRDGC